MIRRDNGDEDDEKPGAVTSWNGVLDVVANRHGPPGRVPVRFDGQRMRFEEIRGPQEHDAEVPRVPPEHSEFGGELDDD